MFLHKIKTHRVARIVIIGAVVSLLFPLGIFFVSGDEVILGTEHPHFWDNLIMFGGFAVFWYPMWILYYLRARKFLDEN